MVQAAESAVREIVGASRIDSVLYEQRGALTVALVKSIQSQLDRLKTEKVAEMKAAGVEKAAGLNQRSAVRVPGPKTGWPV